MEEERGFETKIRSSEHYNTAKYPSTQAESRDVLRLCLVKQGYVFCVGKSLCILCLQRARDEDLFQGSKSSVRQDRSYARREDAITCTVLDGTEQENYTYMSQYL